MFVTLGYTIALQQVDYIMVNLDYVDYYYGYGKFSKGNLVQYAEYAVPTDTYR